MIFVLIHVSFNQLYLVGSRFGKILWISYLYSLNSQQRFKWYTNKAKFLQKETDICIGCVCVCIHMCVAPCVHWYMCTRMHSCTCGERSLVWFYIIPLSFFFPWGKLPCEPKLINSTSLASWLGLGIVCLHLHLPSTGITDGPLRTPDFLCKC